MIEPKQQEFLQCVAQSIYDKKGFNVLVLDVRPCPTMTDFVVIGEGSADVHVKAIARSIIEALEQRGLRPDFVQGLQEGDWVVLDFLWFVVHLFKPSFRDKYELEALWKESLLVDFPVQQSISV